MVRLETRFRVNPEVAFQSLGAGQETVLLSLGTGQLYTCNETTTALLEALDGQRNLTEVVDRLGEQFDVPRERLERDVMKLAERLLAEGLVMDMDSWHEGS